MISKISRFFSKGFRNIKAFNNQFLAILNSPFLIWFGKNNIKFEISDHKINCEPEYRILTTFLHKIPQYWF